MIKFSVKKPFTIVVAVIMIIVVGIVCIPKMQTDLLPDFSLPYMMVITTDPGASPEKIEADVTGPIESALGTVDGVENVISSSNANYSMVTLEFDSETDMDAALVRVTSALNMLTLPESCGTPNVMELSMDMMATMYAAVTLDDRDIFEVSDFTEDVVIPYFERVDGVASVSSIGLVEQTVEVRLDKDLIDEVNRDILAHTNKSFAEAQEEIDKGLSELTNAEATIKSQTSALQSTQTEANDAIAEGLAQLDTAKATKASYEANLNGLIVSKTALETELQAYKDAGLLDGTVINTMLDALKTQIGDLATEAGVKIPENIDEILDDPEGFADFMKWLTSTEFSEDLKAITDEAVTQLTMLVGIQVRALEIESAVRNLGTEILAAEAALDMINKEIAGIDEMYTSTVSQALGSAAQFGSAQAQLASAQTQLDAGKAQLEEAQKTLDETMDNVIKSANIDALVSLETLSSLIYAQNFSMPAGYIDDKNDEQWLLTVGDTYESVEDLKNMVLCKIDGVGTIKLSDVATVVVIDNSEATYANMDGKPAVILSIFKSSTASTSDVSDNCLEAIEELFGKHSGLSIIPISDQGAYIDIFLSSILSSLVIGAILAIVVLALFLKDVKPTIVVAFSIPFSLMTTIIIMYFSGITLNVMSLAGLALAIGMLVDNSIVVMENIYRLRSRGISPARSAVQGAKQVAVPIISSTLTTICVFLPMVFTAGMIQDILVPFALTISYALTASLLIALTVVPTMSTTLLKNATSKSHKWFDKFIGVYEKALRFCLKRKFVPIVLSLILLVFCVFEVSHMGMSLMGEMGGDTITVSVTVPEGTEKHDSFKMADSVIEAALSVDGVKHVGAMDSGATANMLVNASSSEEGDFLNYIFYVTCEEDMTSLQDVKRISQEIEDKTADLPCEVSASSAMSGELMAMASSGISINIYGNDVDKLISISEDICENLDKVEGIAETSNGLENAENELHIEIDKDYAMSKNLTVAQIFQTIYAKLTTEATATEITVDEYDMDVVIVNETDLITYENLKDIEFEVTTTETDGTTKTDIYTLGDFAKFREGKSADAINRENQTRYITVTGTLEEGYNSVLVSREFEEFLAEYDVPEGYSIEISGEVDQVLDMVRELLNAIALGFVLIYLIMVAQFQSLLSPFIVIFTIPLAFTGGLIGMIISGDQITAITLLGFMVLMGTIVNNGIVFVDYTNQLRIQGLSKHDALIAAGKTRMRPILMTALTTILSMISLVFSQDIGSQMARGMAVVVMGGLLYATIMTLLIVPVLYDILYRKKPKVIDIGDENVDDIPDDAAEYLESLKEKETAGSEESETVDTQEK